MQFIQKHLFANKIRFYGFLVGVSLLIYSGGYFFYGAEKREAYKMAESNLQSVTHLKAWQIENWYNERISDAKTLSKSLLFIQTLHKYLLGQVSASEKTLLLQRLELLRESYRYEAVSIVSKNGEITLSTKNTTRAVDSIKQKKILLAFLTQQIVDTDFHYDLASKEFHYEIIAPIVSTEKKVIAVLVLDVNPRHIFFPTIEKWPGGSNSSEVILVSRNRDHFFSLSKLRFANKVYDSLPPGKLKPLLEPQILNAGMLYAKDYRSRQVLAYLYPLKINNWELVAKTDISEVYQDLPTKALLIGGSSLLLSITFSLLLIYLFNVQEKNQYMKQYNAAKEISTSQAFLKTTIDSLTDGVIITDPGGYIKYLNETAAQLTGWLQSEALGTKLDRVYIIKNELTGAIEQNAFEKISKNGLIKELANHTLLISKTGQETPISDTGAPIYTQDGTRIGVVLTFRNETEKRSQQRLLEDSESRLSSTLDNLYEGCQIIGFDWRYLYVNKSTVQQAKKTAAELLGKTMMECYPGIEQTPLFAILSHCMYGRIPQEKVNLFTYPDGSQAWFRINVQPVPRGIFIISQDITKQKQAEDALQETNLGLKILVNNTPDLIYSLNRLLKFSSVNNSFCKEFNIEEQQLLGHSFEQLGLPEQLLEVWKNLCIKVFNTQSKVQDQLQLSLPDGGERIFEVVLIPIHDDEGEIQGIRGINRDVTEQITTDLKLKESNQNIEFILQAIDAGTWDWNFHTNKIQINHRFAEILGYSISALQEIMSTVFDLVHPDDAGAVQEKLQMHIAGNANFFDFEARMKHARGTWVWVQIRGKIVEMDEKHNPLRATGIMLDISRKIADAELFRINNMKLKHLVSDLQEVIWTAPVNDWDAVDANEAIEEILGITAQQLREDKELWLKIVYPEDLEIAKKSANDLLRYGKAEAEYRIVKADGQIVWILDRKSILYDESGTAQQIGGIAKDITEQKNAEQKLRLSELRFRSLIENSSDIILLLNENKQIVFASNSFERIIGMPTTDFHGTLFTDLAIPEDRPIIEEALHSSEKLANVTITIEFRQLHKNGTVLWFDTKIMNLLHQQSINSYVVNCSDITRKVLDSQELLKAKEKAEEMNRLKSNFLANMSHELRTPLIGIMGFSDFLTQDLHEIKYREMAERINQCGQRLSDTLNLILDLSKLESDSMQFNFDTIDILSVAKLVTEALEGAARRKGLSLVINTNCSSAFIDIDRRAGESVLNNLINNAIKYTFYGQVTVSITKHENLVAISIHDTGIGIAKENHSLIFDEFRQVSEGVSRNFEGTGLGLHITKKLVEKFNGHITLESELGKGSLFMVTFPLSKSLQSSIRQTIQTDSPKAVRPSPIWKKKALLVDDDSIAFKVLHRYLIEVVDLRNVATGEEAVSMLAQDHSFDLIFMDMNLGRGMDGLQTTKAIRELSAYAKKPIIALTAYAMVGDREEFINNGCNAYVSKPFTAEQILDIIQPYIM